MVRGSSREVQGRFDLAEFTQEELNAVCRLKPGEIWTDPERGHRVGCLDATDGAHVRDLVGSTLVNLVINDPPYNFPVGEGVSARLFRTSLEEYLSFSRKWIEAISRTMAEDSSLYIFLGADQRNAFQPLPDFMILMRQFDLFRARSFISVRNQRGYGTQKNWMSVRQELLYYARGNPFFAPVYTEIPRLLRGYYKEVGGKTTENGQRSKSGTIRPGNIWVDIQQVFYRLEENVPGAYAQKPLRAIERILEASSVTSDIVLDTFSHSGTTLLACERLGRRCFTSDIDPIFAELTIRRLEHYRETGETGWQWRSPIPELAPVFDAPTTQSDTRDGS